MKALIEVEVNKFNRTLISVILNPFKLNIPISEQQLRYHGQVLTDLSQKLDAIGVQEHDLLFVARSGSAAAPAPAVGMPPPAPVTQAREGMTMYDIPVRLESMQYEY